MAFGRYYKYGYGRRYGSRSVKALTFSRAFKASAANMTQNGKFNINVRQPVSLSVPVANSVSFSSIDVASLVRASKMHQALSNVFDQYRIEKIKYKITPLVNTNLSSTITTSSTNSSTTTSSSINVNKLQSFFTVIDRTGFDSAATIEDLRTYASYKESTWSLNGDSVRPHYGSIGQTEVVNRSTYYDSKNLASFPKIAYGCDIGETNTTGNPLSYSYIIEIDAQVRYRGVRVDTRHIE